MKSEKVKSKKEIRREKKAGKAHLITFLFSLFPFLLISCTSLIQKGGEFLEGSAFNEKTNVIFRTDGRTDGTGSSGESSFGKRKEAIIELRELKSKDGKELIEITNSEWPALALRGSRPGTGGDFELSGAHILSSHVNGWNDFTLDLLGNGVFQSPNGLYRTDSRATGGELQIVGEVERIQISSGGIRLKSSRLTGTAALVALRNRRERILALTEWMNGWLNNNAKPVNIITQKEFEDYWKGRLFPELVSKKKQPIDYSTLNAEWVRADGVNWNRSYTEQVFPEGLWQLRNSGALLRDWEEALPWIFIEYSWETIIASLNGINLQKTRG